MDTIKQELAAYEDTHTTAGAFGDSPRTPWYLRPDAKVWASTTARRLLEYSPGPWNLEAEGTGEYRHASSIPFIGRARRPLTEEEREYMARLIGFLAKCKEDPQYSPLWRLMVRASGHGVMSPTHFGGVQAIVAKHRSPGRAMRTMFAARRRANAILAPWGLCVESRALATALAHSCRPGRVARRAALGTLRFALADECGEWAKFARTSGGYRRLVKEAGSVAKARKVLFAAEYWASDHRTRLARGLAITRRLRHLPPGTKPKDAAAYLLVRCGEGGVWGVLLSQLPKDPNGYDMYPYTRLPEWYHRRKDYVIHEDEDGTRTLLSKSSRTQIGICTVWKTHEPYVWYVEGPRGRTYHARVVTAYDAARTAKMVWKSRRTAARNSRCDLAKRQAAEAYLANPDRDRTVLVRIADSQNAGNCQYGSEQWRDRYFPDRKVVALQELLPYRDNPAVDRVVVSVLYRELAR